MVTTEQKNEMLAIYSKKFGNNEADLKKYASKIDIDNVDIFVVEFTEMQGTVFNYFCDLTEDGTQLSSNEIDQLAEKFINENYAWVNKKAFKSFMNYYLHYMCWHEGIAKN